MKKFSILIISALLSCSAFSQGADSSAGGPLTSNPIARDTTQSAPVRIYSPKYSCVVYTYHYDQWGYAEGVVVYGSNTNESKVVIPSARIPGWYADVYNCTGPNR